MTTITLEDLFADTLTAIRDQDTAKVQENTALIATVCGANAADLTRQLEDAALDADAAEELLDDLQTMGALMMINPTAAAAAPREFNFTIPDQPIEDSHTSSHVANPAGLGGVFR